MDEENRGQETLTPEEAGRLLDGLKDTAERPVLEESWKAENYGSCLALVRALREAGEAVGHPCSCGLRTICQTKYTEQVRLYANQSLALYANMLRQVREKLSEVCRILEKPMPETEEELRQIARFCDIMQRARNLPAAWLFSPRFRELLNDLDEMTENHRKMTDAGKILLERWLPDIFDLNGTMLFEQWQNAHRRNFLKKRRTEKSTMKKLAPFAKVVVDIEDVEPCLRELNEYQTREETVVSIASRYPDELFGLYYNETSDLQDIARFLKMARQTERELLEIKGFPLLQKAKAENARTLQVFYGVWRTFTGVQTSVYKLFQVDRLKRENRGDYLKNEIRMCGTWEKEIGKLKDWIRFRALCAEAKEAGIGRLAELYEEGLAHEELIPVFQKACCLAVCREEKTE